MPESSDWKQDLGPLVRTSQIIVGAMIFGCLTLAVIAVVMGGQFGQAGGGPQKLITYLAIGFAVVAVLARAVVGSVVASSGCRRVAEGTWKPNVPANSSYADAFARLGDAGKLFGVYQTRLIITAALLEGPAFFLLIAYMLEGSVESLVAAGLMILGLVLQFPTVGRVEAWIDSQLKIVEQQRALGGR